MTSTGQTHLVTQCTMDQSKFLATTLTAQNAHDVDLRISPNGFVPSVEAPSTFPLLCFGTSDSAQYPPHAVCGKCTDCLANKTAKAGEMRMFDVQNAFVQRVTLQRPVETGPGDVENR